MSQGLITESGVFNKNFTTVELYCIDGLSNTLVVNGVGYFVIPPILTGYNLTAIHTRVITAGTGAGTLTSVQITNVTDAVSMLSTVCSIDPTATGSDTATTPAVIDTTKDDVVTYDLLRIDVTAINTTPAKGLIVSLTFNLP